LSHLIRLILKDPVHYEFVEARTHREAMSVLRAYGPSLLIMECESEDGTALDRVLEIRSGKAGCKRHIPIIVLLDPQKDVAATSDVQNALAETGPTYCVQKPLSMRTLFPIVSRAIEQDHMRKSGKLKIVAPSGLSSFLDKAFPRLRRALEPKQSLS
jgi:DNA-binding response OmpR family regulator